MASKPVLTEERLRSYLDTNQAARERMCVAVLNLDRRFSDVRPRHPKGGPDGGCDIDATYREKEVACCAVAFKNTANDGEAHKKAIKAKFEADAGKAILLTPKPSMFVFFTNVALTAGEKTTLKKKAQKFGFADCEIFDRERMRIVLDATDGLGVRLQYLDIPMSPAEQASFFAKWGDDIQSLMASRFQSVETTLARLLFLQEARATLGTIYVRFILDRTYSGDEIDHFRAFVSMSFPKMKRGLTSVLFGSTDKSDRFDPHPPHGAPERRGIKHGISRKSWESRLVRGEDLSDVDDASDSHDRYIPYGSGNGIGADEIAQIVVSYNHTHTFDFGDLPRLNLEDIQGAWVMPKLNKSLAEKVDVIEIWADGYVLMSLQRDEFQIDASPTEFPVSGHFSDEELADPWVRIRPAGYASTMTINFNNQTPRRVYETKETGEPIRR